MLDTMHDIVFLKDGILPFVSASVFTFTSPPISMVYVVALQAETTTTCLKTNFRKLYKIDHQCSIHEGLFSQLQITQHYLESVESKSLKALFPMHDGSLGLLFWREECKAALWRHTNEQCQLCHWWIFKMLETKWRSTENGCISFFVVQISAPSISVFSGIKYS